MDLKFQYLNAAEREYRARGSPPECYVVPEGVEPHLFHRGDLITHPEDPARIYVVIARWIELRPLRLTLLLDLPDKNSPTLKLIPSPHPTPSE